MQWGSPLSELSPLRSRQARFWNVILTGVMLLESIGAFSNGDEVPVGGIKVISLATILLNLLERSSFIRVPLAIRDG